MANRKPNYFNGPDEYTLFKKIPKRIWAALVKDFAISTVGEDAGTGAAWREVAKRIEILKANDLL